MNRKVTILDTTLRDGMQGIDVNYTLEDKLEIAAKLDEIGVDYIEGGFPLSNEKESEFFKRLRSMKFRKARVASFGSTRRPNGEASNDAHIRALLDAETETVVIVGKTWTEHVLKVIGTTLDENLAMIIDSIAFLKKEGREVIFDMEHFFDGWKGNKDYALSVLGAGRDAGADVLVCCDTNGGTLPHEIIPIYAELASLGFDKLGGHFHNDCETAVANSIAAIHEGAIHIQGTINGWGERCGNANLCAIMPNLTLKMNYEAQCAETMHHLTALSRFVAEKANIIPNKRQAFVGPAAFAHKAGQHADVILKAANLMEHLDASLVGNTRQILLSELAGKSTIVEKMRKYGSYSKNDAAVQELIEVLKQKEGQGYEYEAAEASFDLLVRQTLGKYKPFVQLKNYHIESFKTAELQSNTIGRIFLMDDAREIMGASVGVGPVGTLDAALRNALTPHYPELQRVKLIDYRVRVLNPESASAAKVRVFITSSDGEENWGTVGVNENIVEASWEALVDSFEYFLNNLNS